MGILYAHQSFWLPGLAPSMYNLGIIFGALVLVPFFGVYGLAIGAIIGALLHLLVQVPGLRRVEAQYSAHLAVRDPGVQEVMRLMLPRMFGVAVVQLNFLVETSLASLLTHRRGIGLELRVARDAGAAGRSGAIGGDGCLSHVCRSILARPIPATPIVSRGDRALDLVHRHSGGDRPAGAARTDHSVGLPARPLHRNLDGAGRGGVGRICVGVDRPFRRGDSGARLLCAA